MQNKKKRLEEFYQQYETNFEYAEELRTIFVRVLGEIEQLLPDIAKTRWRKKSDFYTLFVKLAKHSPQLPLSGDTRHMASELLSTLASSVDQLIRQGGENYSQHVREYVRNVERAASDLGTRRERERVLDEVLSRVFPSGPIPLSTLPD